MTPERWDWDATDGPGPAHRRSSRRRGFAWVRAPELAEAAPREPWACAERLLGERAVLLERQPIRAVPGGRSFSSGGMAAPFHTDSQTLLGVPPHVQVMACRAAAAGGGENLYLDTWALLARLEREDPDLLARLFTTARRLPVRVRRRLRADGLDPRRQPRLHAHRPARCPTTPWPRGCGRTLDSEPVIEVRAAAGDLVVIHNHRLLHGRRAFEDERRCLHAPPGLAGEAWPAPPRWLVRAEAAAAALRDRLRGAPSAVREAYGLSERRPRM